MAGFHTLLRQLLQELLLTFRSGSALYVQVFVFIDIDEDVLFISAQDEHFVRKVEDFSSQLVAAGQLDLDRVS